MKDYVNAEIARKYREAGYQSTITLSATDAEARKNDLYRLAKKNKDAELECIADGAASAYADICEAGRI